MSLSFIILFLAEPGSQSCSPEISFKDYSRHTKYTVTGFRKANDQVGISRDDQEQGKNNNGNDIVQDEETQPGTI